MLLRGEKCLQILIKWCIGRRKKSNGFHLAQNGIEQCIKKSIKLDYNYRFLMNLIYLLR